MLDKWISYMLFLKKKLNRNLFCMFVTFDSDLCDSNSTYQSQKYSFSPHNTYILIDVTCRHTFSKLYTK